MTHILAMETPSAHGRYVCCAASYTMKELAQNIRTHFPAAKPPRIDMTCALGVALTRAYLYLHEEKGNRQFAEAGLGREFLFSRGKIVEELGMEFTDPSHTAVELVHDFLGKGLVPARFGSGAKTPRSSLASKL